VSRAHPKLRQPKLSDTMASELNDDDLVDYEEEEAVEESKPSEEVKK